MWRVKSRGAVDRFRLKAVDIVWPTTRKEQVCDYAWLQICVHIICKGFVVRYCRYNLSGKKLIVMLFGTEAGLLKQKGGVKKITCLKLLNGNLLNVCVCVRVWVSECACVEAHFKAGKWLPSTNYEKEFLDRYLLITWRWVTLQITEQPNVPGVSFDPPSLPQFTAHTHPHVQPHTHKHTQRHTHGYTHHNFLKKRKKDAQILVPGVTFVLCTTVAIETWLV